MRKRAEDLVELLAGFRTTAAIKTSIAEGVLDNKSAAEIHRELGDRPDLSERTIRTAVSKLRGHDLSAPSHLEKGGDVDAALVLPVLGAVIEQSEGRIRTLTRAQAEWITSIRRAAPDLTDPLHVYELALVALGGKAEHVEQQLAFRPWLSDEHRARWETAKAKGWVGTAVTARLAGTINLEAAAAPEAKSARKAGRK